MTTRSELQELVDEMRNAYDMSDEEIFDTITEYNTLTEKEAEMLAKILGIL